MKEDELANFTSLTRKGISSLEDKGRRALASSMFYFSEMKRISSLDEEGRIVSIEFYNVLHL